MSRKAALAGTTFIKAWRKRPYVKVNPDKEEVKAKDNKYKYMLIKAIK